MKRIVALLLFLPAIALGQDLPAKHIAALSETGAGLSRGLTFHAPFTDPANPLTVYKGSALAFARAHDATHTATYLHPTTGLVTVASADQLRIEAQGALFEEAKTNLYTYSEQFNNIAWTAAAANLTVTADNSVAPDGTLTADLVVLDNGVGGGPVGYFNRTVTLVAPYSMSVFLKNAGRDVLVLQDGSGNGAIFNLTAKTATVIGGAFVSASIQQMLSGWYRCKVNYATGANASPHFFSYFNTAGDGVNGMYFWGAQLEAGVPVSSYIPAVAATTTRNADAITFPTIASPGTAMARVDGTMQEVDYATFDPTGHHVKDFREWDRVLSAGEISAVVGP